MVLLFVSSPFDVVVDFGAIELDKVDDLVVFVDVEVDETPRKMFSLLLYLINYHQSYFIVHY